MNRIDIIYGGRPYSLGGRSIEAIQVEIDGAIAAGLPYWLQVNSGEGRFEDAYLLIAPGVPVAMINVKPNGVDHAGDDSAGDDRLGGDAVDSALDDTSDFYNQD